MGNEKRYRLSYSFCVIWVLWFSIVQLGKADRRAQGQQRCRRKTKNPIHTTSTIHTIKIKMYNIERERLILLRGGNKGTCHNIYYIILAEKWYTA